MKYLHVYVSDYGTIKIDNAVYDAYMGQVKGKDNRSSRYRKAKRSLEQYCKAYAEHEWLMGRCPAEVK